MISPNDPNPELIYSGFFRIIYMDEDIKNSIIILSLENLIIDYESALEVIEITPEDREYIQFIIDSAKLILTEADKPSTTISRPKW